MRRFFLTLTLVASLSAPATAQSLSAEGLLQRLQPALDAVAESLGQGVNVRFVPSGALTPLSLPDGELQVDVPALGDLLSRRNLPVLVRVDQRLAANLVLPGSLEIYGPALLATELQPRGAGLDPQHLRLEPKAEWKRRCLPLAALPEGAWSLKRPLAPQQLLCEEDIEPRELVGRGQSVTVTLIRGALSLENRARARDGGALGETIRVVAPGGRELRAVVTGVGAARLLE